MFYSSSSFEIVKKIETQWQRIQEEYRGLDPTILDVHRNGSHTDYFAKINDKNGWVPSWKVGSTEKNFQWLTYAVCMNGEFPGDTEERLPFTVALLKECPQLTVCAFSNMKGLSMIPPHSHPELGGNILTFHLGIDIPKPGGFLWVNGVFEAESEGKSLVFDGSLPHFAINVSDADRVVMYMEFDRSRSA